MPLSLIVGPARPTLSQQSAVKISLLDRALLICSNEKEPVAYETNTEN